MFLVDKRSGDLVRIVDLEALFDPFHGDVNGQSQAGEEEQDPELFEKHQLMFASGESLPTCWLDPDYRHVAPAARAANHA